MPAALVVAVALALAVARAADVADPPPLRVFHRLLHPSHPDLPFAQRGVLSLSRSSATLVPSLADTFTALAPDAVAASAPDVLYQLALEHPGDRSPAQWHVSSVKACHLPRSTAESITLHLAPDGSPYALDYFLSPVPHNGACPASHPFLLPPILNSTITVRVPTLPPLPQLRTPPPLTPEGNIVQPAPEKNFFQKYWVYILVAVVALVMSPAAPEDDAKRGSK